MIGHANTRFLMTYKNIPVKAAKAIAEEYEKNQVILVCWDDVHKRMHVTTYGKTVDECALAAEGGNAVKEALGWPDRLCHDEPSRIKKLKEKVSMTQLELAKSLVLFGFFKGDKEKAELWWITANPLLGGVKPIEMVMMGRPEKVLAFIKNQLAENEPPDAA